MDKLSKNQLIVLVVAVLAVGIGGGLFIGSRLSADKSGAELQVIQTPSEPISEPAATTLNIYVTGAVLHPDVYSLPNGSLVKDALKAAGGTTKDADLLSVNLAARLADNEQVTVPVKGTAATSLPGTTTGRSGTSTKISINNGNLTDLDSLPGIGPAKAQAIITYRTEHGPFKRLEDLKNVKGIGDKTFEDLKLLITL